MMKWLKKRKKAKEETETKRREFLSTLKYGANLDEQWREHRRLEKQRRDTYERVTQTALYKEYEQIRKEERETELAVLDAIRREHGLPISERRWNDGHLVVYDTLLVHECTESPIGYCVAFTPDGSSIGTAHNCLFCEKVI